MDLVLIPWREQLEDFAFTDPVRDITLWVGSFMTLSCKVWSPWFPFQPIGFPRPEMEELDSRRFFVERWAWRAPGSPSTSRRRRCSAPPRARICPGPTWRPRAAPTCGAPGPGGNRGKLLYTLKGNEWLSVIFRPLFGTQGLYSFVYWES